MDREKVIYDIERCICHVPDACRDCSHYGHGEVIGCMEELLNDALALLKENQPKKGHWIFHQDECGYESFDCSVCGMWFDTDNKIFRRRISSFCPNCGADMREGDPDA